MVGYLVVRLIVGLAATTFAAVGVAGSVAVVATGAIIELVVLLGSLARGASLAAARVDAAAAAVAGTYACKYGT